MKKNVAIVFGGKSGEHEVSIQSALNIYRYLDKEKFDGFLVGVDKEGNFRFLKGEEFIENKDDPKKIAISLESDIVEPIKGEDGSLLFFNENNGSFSFQVDFVFPIIHGTLGEDGCIQGFLKWLEIPFAGASVLGSAIGMDKDVTKRLLKEAGIPVCKFYTFRNDEYNEKKLVEKAKELGFPVFVKPSNTGSSLGISKVKNSDEVIDAVKKAFQFDRKILIEEGIIGRELECSVLGNSDVKVSCFGEIIPNYEFYSYEAKYIDNDGAKLIAPASLDEKIEARMREIAKKAFKVLECEGMARVDFFLSNKGKIYLNEINTLPGFTKISMYPRLWELSGISYTNLITKLIELGFERFEFERTLKTKKEF